MKNGGKYLLREHLLVNLGLCLAAMWRTWSIHQTSLELDNIYNMLSHPSEIATLGNRICQRKFKLFGRWQKIKDGG